MHTLTVCDTHQPPGSTQLATPALPCPHSVLRPWIPSPRKGHSSAAVGQHTEGSWLGWTLYGLQVAVCPWLCHSCTSLNLLGPLHHPGRPSAGKAGGLGSLVLVQHPLMCAEQHLLFWCFASSLLPSFHSSNVFVSGSLDALRKQLSLFYKWGNRHTFYFHLFLQVSQFWETEFETVNAVTA